MESSPSISFAEQSNLSSTNDTTTFKINYIPKEKIKKSSILNTGISFHQDCMLNESYSVSREKKNFYLENMTSFLQKENLDQLIKVNFYF